MGKGDKKTKKGKIWAGSYGKSRKRKDAVTFAPKPKKKAAAKKEEAPVAEKPAKKAPAKKPAAKKAPAKKNPAAKK
jgi:30S ribosomal protein S31